MDSLKDQQYDELKNELQKIDIPNKHLEQAIITGYRHYRKERKHKQRIAQIIIALAFIIIAFSLGVRNSPAFARVAAQIPGLEPLVELIVTDKGIDDIVKNDYVEMLNLKATENDFQFTLLSAIVDETGLVLSYELQRASPFSNIQVKEVELRQNGRPMQVGVTMIGNDIAETTKIQNSLQCILANENTYKGKNFELFIMFDDAAQTSFTIPFELTKPIQRSKKYTLNKSFQIDKQTVIVQNLSISPLRAKVTLAIPNSNTEQLLQFGTVALIDEKGEEWGKITNGIVGNGDIRDGQVSIYIQSNYFRKPESLVLRIENIEALPKGEDYIVVDFQKKKIVQLPKSLDVQLEMTSNHSIDAVYRTVEQNHIGQLLGKALDANNKVFSASVASHLTDEEKGFVKASYNYDIKNVANPVKINIESYPRYLKGNIELHIPME